MGDLTDAVNTIVGLLKDSSTGIGTTGYEITDDDSNSLTISNGEILVSYHMNKEKLKDSFGGSQDFDVVFTVKSGEIKDEWIGLSTKMWSQPVIIEINIIDKWSAVGTGNKYITAPLVREKAINALRKFIKANTQAPGGTISLWLAKTFKNEEDISVKPTIYKCVVTTEAWMYYNPDEVTCKTGEQVSNGGLEDGDFGGWINNRWEVSTDSPYAGTYCAKSTTVGSTLEQKFNIKVSCFTVNSTAQVRYYGGEGGNPCNPDDDDATMTLIFDNGYTIEIYLNGTGSWGLETFLQEILDAVDASSIGGNDTLISIMFEVTDIDVDSIKIDDLTIVADGI